MGYSINRERVYKIYGIDINDHSYNCHHIVTREDVKLGLVSPNFDIHGISNLIPLKVREHNEIHKYLYQLEKNNKPENSIPEPQKDSIINPENSKRTVFVDTFWSIMKYQQRKERISRNELLAWKRGNLCDL